jgi:tetraacyldisaccharide 4'-kinase
MDMKKYFYELMTDKRKGPPDKIVQWLMLALSRIYGVVASVTQAMYHDRLLSVYRSHVPVVSVGNITTGGVGKTPFVIWLARTLKDKGLKVVVLSRGYGAAQGLNDEAKMFKEILPDVPIVTGANRKKSIQETLKEKHVDLFVADDAFQHWPLHRDLDIVLIDATNPFGNGHLVPRGILRES